MAAATPGRAEENPRGCLEHPDAGFRTERSRLAKIDPGGKPAVNIGR
jgi:hypothetical protein